MLGYLENQPECNVLWVDLFQDEHLWDWSRSSGVRYVPEERAVVLSDGPHLVGELTSFVYRSKGGAKLRRLRLMYNAYTPSGTSIAFFYSTDGVNFHPLTPNADPVDPPGEATSLVFRVRLERRSPKVTPRLDAVAIGFFDRSWEPEIALVDDDTALISPIIYHSQLLGIGADDHHQRFIGTGEPANLPKSIQK